MLDKLIDKVADNELAFFAVVILAFMGFLYLRNGSEYFTGKSGGAYWDNPKYCDTHPAGQMNIYGRLVGCAQIRAYRRYCERHSDEEIPFAGDRIPCDQILGKPEPPSSLDAF